MWRCGNGGNRSNPVIKVPEWIEVIGTIREFGDYLGDEIAVSVSIDEKGEPTSPLVLAELRNAAGFRQFLEQQIAKYAGKPQGRPAIQFVDNPATAVAATPEAGKNNDALYVWIQSDLFAASPKLQQLQDLATIVQKGGTSSFTATPFHNRIASDLPGGRRSGRCCKS